MHDARILASRHMRLSRDATRKDVRAAIHWARAQPVLQRGSGQFRDLELNRMAGLVLDDRRPVPNVSAGRYVIDLKADEIAPEACCRSRG